MSLVPDAPQRPLVAVAGPTGSGKSELALALAERFDGEIVNCDSLQVYRHFDIGAAKLPLGERRGIPHHLIDILDPDQLFTAGEYARLARASHRRHLRPRPAAHRGRRHRILPARAARRPVRGPSRDQPLRDRLAAREARRPGSLHRLLSRFDSAAAGRIHPHDVPKVTRALEVCLLARRPVSELFRAGPRRPARLPRAQARPAARSRGALRPPRCALRAPCSKRGLVEEVRRILALGFPPPPSRSNRTATSRRCNCIRGELNPREAVFYAQRNTRQYAKRQITWFRREPGMEWLKGFGEEPHIRDAAVRTRGVFPGLRKFHGTFSSLPSSERVCTKISPAKSQKLKLEARS